MTLEFDEPTHTYKLDGKPVPSVTGVLRAAGLCDARWWTPAARERGKVIAQAMELDCQNDLDYASLDPDVQPYIDAWRWFRSQPGVRILHAELRVAHPILGYAGTLDVLADINGARAILDAKSGCAYPWHGVQLAAYADTFVPRPRRFGLYLKPDGGARLHEYSDRQDFDIYRAALALTRWKENHR